MNSDELQARQETRYIQMTQTPIPRLICTLSVPTIISMLTTSIYNMADTYFVSQLGTSASGAVGIVFSLMAMIQAVGFTLGMGAGNYVSRMLGQRQRQKAGEAAATAFFSALLCGLLLAVLGNLFIERLVRGLGATDTIYPYARDYAQYILLGAPYMSGSFVLNNLLRSQGSAFYSMIGITAGGLLNILLDPLFIFVFDLGIGGAALATILSQLISFGILLYFSMGRNGNIGVSPRNIRLQPALIGEIVKLGFPTLCRQGMASLAAVFLNLGAAPFGDAAIAAMSIVNRVTMFIGSALIGFGQGFQPVCGFNYGARRYDRVTAAFWFCVRVAVLSLAVAGAVMFGLAPYVLTAFRRSDPEVIAIGTLALRLQCLMLPFQAWSIMCNMLAQSIARSGRATILAMGRQGLFFLPGIWLLPPALGLLGVQLAQPVADAFTFVLAVFLGGSLIREIAALARRPDEGGPPVTAAPGGGL